MPFWSRRCISKKRLDGITAIVTGSNTGIGKETVLDFYKRGARVIMACRDLTKANTAKEYIIKSSFNTDKVGEIVVMKLDLLSLISVRKFADEVLKTESKIHILINNAGIYMSSHRISEDGFEYTYQTNYLSHFLLTLLLFPRIADSKPARIVNVSSIMYKYGDLDLNDVNYEKRGFHHAKVYGQSKLAVMLFTKYLTKFIKENNIVGVNVYSLHPGFIVTDIGRYIRGIPIYNILFWICGMFFKSSESGAQTTIYCAVDENCANDNGLYYQDCMVVECGRKVEDMKLAKKLWDVSLKLVGLEKWIYCHSNHNI